MKKTTKYFAVNNQEDEDGYILYPENTTLNKKANKEQDTSSRNNIANSVADPAKSRFRNFIVSATTTLNKIIKK